MKLTSPFQVWLHVNANAMQSQYFTVAPGGFLDNDISSPARFLHSWQVAGKSMHSEHVLHHH